MVELIDETADEEEEEEIVEEDLGSVETSEKSSNISIPEAYHVKEQFLAQENTKEIQEEEPENTKEDYENETFEYESNFEVEIRSTPPSNLPEGVHLFNMSLLHSTLDDISLPPMRRRPFKNGTRQSLTFTNDQMWEIERQNRILMERIFRPSGSSRCSLRPPVS